MDKLNNIYFTTTLISMIIAIISLRYTVRIKKYLEEFIYVSKKVSNKEFHSRLNISVKGELGELATNFNYMIEKMDTTIKEVEDKHIQLKSILKSNSDGIIALDIDGNILLINGVAKKIIKCKKDTQVEGKNIKLVVKEDDILREINSFIYSKKSEKKRINTSDDKVYKIKSDPIYLQNTENVIIGSIINIEDITERVRLENMRSDFVENVTHELKTPLTSISGFVETLRLNENIDSNTRNKFLGIIENESDRLKRLIDDILLLSFIEHDKGENLLQEVNVYQVFEEVYEMSKYIAKEKNISILYEIDDKSTNILSNRDYIKQIFINLIDNAIKYTPSNGKVKVIIKSSDKDILIKVIDNGIGISKEDINRVFERFYRVDKARTRDVGGTGLGLAILKHIIKSLNGTIELKSELHIGSEFIVNIPKKNFLK